MIQGEIAAMPVAGLKAAMNQTSFRLNLKSLNIGLAVLLAALALAYVAAINALSVSSFALRDLKKELASLNESNTALEAKISYLSSYNYLKDKMAALEMVAVEDTLFIAKNNQLAKIDN